MQRTAVRILGPMLATAAALSFAVPSAGATPAHCDRTGVCTPPSPLRWSSPSSIADGVAATFSSTGRCPTVRPDGSPLQCTLEVQETVLFSFGGAMGDIAPVPGDGRWTFVKTFDAETTRPQKATGVASCV